ncbi:MAG: FAD-dependent oxidoreductase [Pseudomonadota bacterium]
MSERVCVIGAGLMGVTSAYELQSRGFDVTLIDKADHVAMGASFANGGMLTPSMADPWNAPGVGRQLLSSLNNPYSPVKLRLKALPSLIGWGLKFLKYSSPELHREQTRAAFLISQYSLERTRALREKLGLGYDAASIGTMKIFRTEKDMAGPIDQAQRLGEEAELPVQILDRAGVIAREPTLAPVAEKIHGGLYFPADECGDAHMFCKEVADAFVGAGGKLRLATDVQELRIENGHIRGLTALTPDGAIAMDCEHIIVASGALSPQFARSCGVRLPIRPAKGYSVTIEAHGLNDLPQVPVLDDLMHAAVTPLGSRLRLVGTAEFTGFDPRMRQTRIDNLFRLLEELFPDIARRIDRSQAKPWTGFRPMSADGVPFIGATPVRGFWVNTGHGQLGWTMAQGSAELLADLMTGTNPAIDATPYDVMRHTPGAAGTPPKLRPRAA